MDRCAVLTLIKSRYGKDAMGQSVPESTPQEGDRREVFCQIGSVSAAEWLEAGKKGINPQFRATMFADEYEGEQLCELDGQRYKIYRTYLGKGETIELYLGRKAGVVNGRQDAH